MQEIPLPLVLFAIALIGFVMVWRPAVPVVLFGLLAPLGLAALPASLDVVTVLACTVVVAAGWEHLARAGRLVPTGLVSIGAWVWTLGIVASVAFSADPGHSAVFGAWQVLAVWFAIAVASVTQTTSRLEWIVAAVLIGASAVCVAGLTSGLQLQSTYDASVVTGRAVGIFSQPNEYGLYCAMVWAFSLGIACMRAGYLRALSTVCAMVSLTGLAVSFSRGSWLGALVAAVVMAALIPQTRLPQMAFIVVIVVAVAGSLVAVPYWNLPGLLLARFLSIFSGDLSPYEERPALLAEGVRQFTESPLLGVGPNMYPETASEIGSGTRTIGGDHAHNFLVTIGAEQGVVGLLGAFLLFLGLGATVRIARRNLLASGRTLQDAPLASAVSLASAGALCAAGGAGLVDFPMRNALIRLTVWMFVGLALTGGVKRVAHRASDVQPASERAWQAATVGQVTTL